MKLAAAAMLLAGIALLGLILYQTDLAEVVDRLREIGGWGVAAVLGVFFIGFVLQTVSWHLTLPSARRGGRWLYALWKVLMVGDALNRLTPGASVGGEPLKVAVLKKHYGIGYQASTASLMLQLTVQNIGLIPFLLIGLALTVGIEALPASHTVPAAVALAAFTAAIAAFFLLQRHKVLSRLGGWLGSGRFGARARALLALVHAFEDQLVAFYRGRRRRFAVVVTLEFGIWLLTAVEIMIALHFLGHPISWGAAWVLAAAVALVQSSLFFVPGNIGTQEAAFVIVGGAITGSPAVALALAVIIRFREIVWIAWGLLLGWFVIASPRAGVAGLGTNIDSRG